MNDFHGVANHSYLGVRPALQLELSSANFTSVGNGTLDDPYVVNGE
jgi:hypothetical protein